MTEIVTVMRISGDRRIFSLIDSVQAVTRGKIVKFSLDMTENAIVLYIKHHDHPSCPNCGSEIHSQGHGLCRSCWEAARTTNRW